MSDALRLLVEQRLLKGRLFFSFREIKVFVANFFLFEIEELVRDGKLDRQMVDIVRKEIALKLNLWAIYPTPAKPPIPDPQEVKTAIRQRIAQMRQVNVKLPDERRSSDNFLDDVFASLCA